MAADSIQEDRKRKDEAVRATIMQKLIETGEKERLKEMLRCVRACRSSQLA